MTFISVGIVSGALAYDSSTNSIVGIIDADSTTLLRIRRTVRAVSGGVDQITDSVLTLNDQN